MMGRVPLLACRRVRLLGQHVATMSAPAAMHRRSFSRSISNHTLREELQMRDDDFMPRAHQRRGRRPTHFGAADAPAADDMLSSCLLTPDGLLFRPFSTDRPSLNWRTLVLDLVAYLFLPVFVVAAACTWRRIGLTGFRSHQQLRDAISRARSGRHVQRVASGPGAAVPDFKATKSMRSVHTELMCTVTLDKLALCAVWLLTVASISTYYGRQCHSPEVHCETSNTEVFLPAVLYLLYVCIRSHNGAIHLEQDDVEPHTEQLWWLEARASADSTTSPALIRGASGGSFRGSTSPSPSVGQKAQAIVAVVWKALTNSPPDTSGAHHTQVVKESLPVSVWVTILVIVFVQGLLGPVFRAAVTKSPCSSQEAGWRALQCYGNTTCNVYDMPHGMTPASACNNLNCSTVPWEVETQHWAVTMTGGQRTWDQFLTWSSALCTMYVSYLLLRQLVRSAIVYRLRYTVMVLVHNLLLGKKLVPRQTRHLPKHLKREGTKDLLNKSVPALTMTRVEDVSVAYTVSTYLKSAANLRAKVTGVIPLLYFLFTTFAALVGLVLDILLRKRVQLDVMLAHVMYATVVTACFALWAMIRAFQSNDKQRAHAHALCQANISLAFRHREAQLERLAIEADMDGVRQASPRSSPSPTSGASTPLSPRSRPGSPPPPPALRLATPAAVMAGDAQPDRLQVCKAKLKHMEACLEVLSNFLHHLQHSDPRACVFGVEVTAGVLVQAVAVVVSSVAIQGAFAAQNDVVISESLNSGFFGDGRLAKFRCG